MLYRDLKLIAGKNWVKMRLKQTKMVFMLWVIFILNFYNWPNTGIFKNICLRYRFPSDLLITGKRKYKFEAKFDMKFNFILLR